MLTQDDLNKIGDVMDKKLVPVKKDIKILRRDLEKVLGSLDKDRWNLEQKFDSHVSHPPKAFAS